MPSNMKREYAAQPKGGKLNRSMFNLGKRHLTTFDGGYLIPIFWNWVFPGEVVKNKFAAFLRASSPLEFPLFDNMKLTIHSYFCPLRIVWTNARKFLGEQDDPGDSISYTIPEYGNSTMDTSVVTNQSMLARYMGVPTRTAAQGSVAQADLSAIPFRAYNSIYNWHYRDENQQNSLTVDVDDGPDTPSNYQIRKRGKRHDRFTSLLSAPQKGDSITIGGEVQTAATGGQNPVLMDGAGAIRYLDSDAATVDMGTTAASTTLMYPNTTINELRNAAALQQFLERDNRYGTRYDEIIYSHYGVEFNDVRIAPIYLGGGSGYIQTSAIPNQSATTGNLGDLAAIATGVLEGAGYTYAVDEPGIVISIANVSADLSYTQGLHKGFTYRTRYDLFWPEFVGIGDQAVEMKELYYQNDANDETVMGYEPRYEELRTDTNSISGEFDPGDLLPLDVMHLSEELGSQPVLGDTWISDSTPWDRVLKTTTQHNFMCDFRQNLKIARALPVNGVPGIGRL